MKNEGMEILVGAFVLIGLFCIGYMTVKLGHLNITTSDEYTLKAHFVSITGLKKRARIEISGIEVGYVVKRSLDQENQLALVEMRIQKKIKLGDDVIASVKTSGLIGDKYIELTPGGSDDYLNDGDFITETESSVDIEELIGKYVFGGAEKK